MYYRLIESANIMVLVLNIIQFKLHVNFQKNSSIYLPDSIPLGQIKRNSLMQERKQSFDRYYLFTYFYIDKYN